MTIGERIQQYRKAQKLSQEELAGKLFVSRQTISLWENDQTLPTIDNLIRLKEIFNISLDELLTGTDGSPEISPAPEPSHPIDTAPPVEAYTFRYTRDELAAYFKTFNRKNGIVTRIAVIFLFLGCILALISPEIVVGVVIGILALLISLYSLVIFLRSRKGQLEALQKVPLRTYLYELYNDYMTVTISTTTDDELQSKWQVPYVAITQVWETDELLVLEYQKRIFFLRKRALSPYSQIHAPLASKVRHRWMKKPLSYKLAIALFVATLLSIWAALLCVAFASQFAADFSGNMWIFFLFLPIPIASLIVGILLRRKGFKTLKNIIAGAIISPLLLIYGSFTFLFSGMGFDLTDIEARTGIDLPEPIATESVAYNARVSTSGSDIFYTYYLYFDEEDAKAFETQIAEDERWLTEVSSDFVPVIWEGAELEVADYFILYNINEGEYNLPPDLDGEYSYIYILYDADENRAELTESSFSDGESETPEV